MKDQRNYEIRSAIWLTSSVWNFANMNIGGVIVGSIFLIYGGILAWRAYKLEQQDG